MRISPFVAVVLFLLACERPPADRLAGPDAAALALASIPVNKFVRLGGTIVGSEASELLGTSVAGAGDVDGDGFDDVIAGAYGKAFLYAGSADGLVVPPVWTAEVDQTLTDFGGAVAGAGDVNGDGFADVIVGARLYDNGSINEGGVWVYHGSASGLSATANWTAESNQASADFGERVAAAGDVDGDGYGDVLVGADNYDGGSLDEGRVYVFMGSAAGLSAEAALTLELDVGYANFPDAIASAGDVNGDGYDDVVIGHDEASNGLDTYTGAAYVHLGSAKGLSSTPDWTVLGEDPLALIGLTVSSAGDVDADGFSDVLVGSPEYGGSHLGGGAVRLYRGSALGLEATAAWTAAGATPDGDRYLLASAGDVDGDGRADILIGGVASAELYLGAAGGAEAAPVWSDESYPSAFYGYPVAGVGDVNGDGKADFVVGARGFDVSNNEGALFVYLGGCAASGDADADGFEDPCDACPGSDDALDDADRDGVCAPDDCDDEDASAYPGAPERCDGADNACLGVVPSDEADADADGQLVCEGDVDDAAPVLVPAWSWSPAEYKARAGTAVSSAGDVDGDGHGDLLVGAGGFWPWLGAVYMFRGAGAGLDPDPTWREFDGVDDAWGTQVAAAGDVNGDAFADVVIGDPWDTCCSSNEGYVAVYLGDVGGLQASPDWFKFGDYYSELGGPVASAGDVDGDGFDDILVGAVGADMAMLFRGSANGVESAASWRVAGPPNAGFPHALASAGDVNGDGFLDVIAGAWLYGGGEANEGAAFLYLGSAAGLDEEAAWTAEPDQVDALFGYAVAAAGDVDGDGFDDVIVGAPYYDGAQVDGGAAFVYRGTVTGLEATPAWVLEGAAESLFGWAVAGAGDVDGDGLPEVLVGAPNHAHDGVPRGRALMFSGSASGLDPLPVWAVISEQTYAWFGEAVASAGDVNGDGLPEVVVGARDEEISVLSEGRVHVYTVAPVPADVDGDGVPDDSDVCPGADDAVYDADQDGACALAVDGALADCDDADPTRYPGAPELCDGLDNACAGALPADEVDADIDGYLACAECDDAAAQAHPGLAETCGDALDNDCNGAVDEGCDPTTAPTTTDTGVAGGPPTEEPNGCGCRAGPGPGGAALLLFAVLWTRRQPDGRHPTLHQEAS